MIFLTNNNVASNKDIIKTAVMSAITTQGVEKLIDNWDDVIITIENALAVIQ